MFKHLRFLASLTALLGALVLEDGGGDGGDAGGSSGSSGDGDGPATGTDGGRVDTAALAAATAQGKSAAADEIAELLGMTPAEAKKLIDEKTAADKAAMSEVERKQAEADEKLAAAAKAKAEAEQTRDSATITAALAAAGVTNAPDQLVPLVQISGDVTAETAAAAVEELKKARPGLFDTAGTGTKVDHSTGRSGAGSSGAAMSAKERAAAAFAARKNHRGLTVIGGGGNDDGKNAA